MNLHVELFDASAKLVASSSEAPLHEIGSAATWVFENGTIARYLMDVTGAIRRATYAVEEDPTLPSKKALVRSDGVAFDGQPPTPWMWNSASG